MLQMLAEAALEATPLKPQPGHQTNASAAVQAGVPVLQSGLAGLQAELEHLEQSVAAAKQRESCIMCVQTSTSRARHACVIQSMTSYSVKPEQCCPGC